MVRARHESFHTHQEAGADRAAEAPGLALCTAGYSGTAPSGPGPGFKGPLVGMPWNLYKHPGRA